MKGFKNTTRTKYETGGQVVAPQGPVTSTLGMADKVAAIAGAVKRPTPMPPAPTKGVSPMDMLKPIMGRPAQTGPVASTPKRPTPMPPKRGDDADKHKKPLAGKPQLGRSPAPSQSGSLQAQRGEMLQSVAGKGANATVNAGTRMAKGGSAKKGVPAHSGKPMIGRKASGLAVMPKGKC